MKFLYPVLCFLIASTSSLAQLGGATSYLSDFNGAPITASKAAADIKGSPYLNEVWASGQVFTAQNKKFDVEKMRFNILLNRLEYEANGSTYELLLPCQLFMINLPTDEGTFSMRSFRNGFPAVDDQNTKTYYELVYNGEVKLLRLHKIRVTEHAEPLSLVSIKRYAKVSSLYLYHPEKNITVKASKKKTDVLAFFDDKREAIEKFMLDNDMKKSISEGSLMRLCQYYDNL